MTAGAIIEALSKVDPDKEVVFTLTSPSYLRGILKSVKIKNVVID